MNILSVFFTSLLVLMGILFCNSSIHMGIGNPRNPGPGFLPFAAGALLVVLSLAAAFEERRRGEPPMWKGMKSVAALSVFPSLIVYTLFLDVLGFLLDTLLILTLLFAVSGKHSWKVILMASLLTTASAFLLFGYVLKIPLPVGLINF